MRAWARVELGIPRAEFDQLAPQDIGDLVKAWKSRVRRENHRAGVIASLIANAHRDPKTSRKPFKPSDFFADLEDTRPRRKMTPAEIMAACRRIVGKPPPSRGPM